VLQQKANAACNQANKMHINCEKVAACLLMADAESRIYFEKLEPSCNLAEWLFLIHIDVMGIL
jgi:hypothetical protein